MDFQLIPDGSPTWNSAPDGNSRGVEQLEELGCGWSSAWASGGPKRVPKISPAASPSCPGEDPDPDPVGFPGKTSHFDCHLGAGNKAKKSPSMNTCGFGFDGFGFPPFSFCFSACPK